MMKKSLLLTLVCACLTVACTPNYSKEYEQAKASLDLSASCDELWNELWPAARKGDYVARDLLAELVAERGLKIPGQPSDKNWVDTYLNLVVHKNMLEGSSDETKKKMELLGSDSVGPPHRAYIKYCFLSRGSVWGNASRQGCVNRAVEYGLIQPFNEFIESVDRHLQTGKKVTCVNKLS